MKLKKIIVSDSIQKDYSYFLTQPVGKNFDPDFTPELTPKQMLELGVFGGHYLNDCKQEFPKDWFTKAKLSDHGCDSSMSFLEYLQVNPLWYGNRKVGYFMKIHVDGFNGIADIIWDEEYQMKTGGRS